MEVLLDATLGAFLGCIYVWPFRTSKAYLLTNRGPWTTARAWSLVKKVASIAAALVALLVAITVMRATAVKSRQWLDLAAFLAAAVVSGVLVWRLQSASPSNQRLERP